MNTKKKYVHATTISADIEARDYINQAAAELGLSQRQMLTRMVETYEMQRKADTQGTSSPQEVLDDIHEGIKKVIKRDDRVVAFIREQERVLLNPIFETVKSTEDRVNQLIRILSNL